MDKVDNYKNTKRLAKYIIFATLWTVAYLIIYEAYPNNIWVNTTGTVVYCSGLLISVVKWLEQ